MAGKGDTVECYRCYRPLRLDNDRVPMHRALGGHSGKLCPASGVPADGWDPVHAVKVQGVPMPLVLSCPMCGDKHQIGNASGVNLKCGVCGHEDGVEDFLKRSIARHLKLQEQAEAPAQPRRSRYGAR